MVVERKQSTVQRPTCECKSHLPGRSSFKFLINMTHIKSEIKMISEVPRHYVRQKSELTERIQSNRQKHYIAYRTQLVCECSDLQNIRPDGAIVIDEKNGKVISYLIRCKGCANRHIE